MVPRNLSTAAFAQNLSSEGKSIRSAASPTRLMYPTATSLGLINSAARKGAICLFLKDKARAVSGVHVYLVSNYEHDAIKKLPVLDAKSWGRSV